MYTYIQSSYYIQFQKLLIYHCAGVKVLRQEFTDTVSEWVSLSWHPPLQRSVLTTSVHVISKPIQSVNQTHDIHNSSVHSLRYQQTTKQKQSPPPGIYSRYFSQLTYGTSDGQIRYLLNTFSTWRHSSITCLLRCLLNSKANDAIIVRIKFTGVMSFITRWVTCA